MRPENEKTFFCKGLETPARERERGTRRPRVQRHALLPRAPPPGLPGNSNPALELGPRLGSATTHRAVWARELNLGDPQGSGHLQGDVVGHPLGLREVLGLVLRDHVPADAAVDAVLEQHGFVGGARAAHVTVAAVRLRTAPNLQNKHDFAENTGKRASGSSRRVILSNFFFLTFAISEVRE